MLSGHRSAWRRRGRNSRAARIAVPLAIPMALGLTLGVVLVVSGGKPTQIDQSALGSCANPAASASAAADQSGNGRGQGGQSGNGPGQGGQSGNGPGQGGQSGNGPGQGGQSGNGSGSGDPSATAAPSADPSGSASPTADPCPSASASGTSADPAAPTATPSATAAAAATNMNCTLIAPADPLSARGLATPYQLTGPGGPGASGCNMANSANLGAFVQATILEPGGTLDEYDPLVVTQGVGAAAAPPVPDIPAGSVITIDVGFNGNVLQVGGRGGRYFVQGLPGSPFGQVSFANGPAFFAAAKAAGVTVPALGTSPVDGMACPTVHDFSLVDQDPSDNVTSEYEVTASGQTAEQGSGVTGTIAANGSDNRLLDDFVDPALGCTPFQVPSLSDPGTTEATQATDELLADADQKAPIALVEPNDPMTTVGVDADINANVLPTAANLSLRKTNLYRASLGQQLLTGSLVSYATYYCEQMQTVGAQRLALDAQFETGPSPTAGMDLAQFLAQRYAASVQLENCALFGGLTVPAVPAAPSQTDPPSSTATPTDPTPTVTPDPSPSGQ
jgi:hypothetical protein